MSEPFEIREDKVSMIVTTPSDGSGFKTEAMWLIEACGGRWVHKADAQNKMRKACCVEIRKVIKFNELLKLAKDL